MDAHGPQHDHDDELAPHHDHDHHDHDHHGEGEASSPLLFAIGLLLFTLVAEVVGGLLTGSLALLADSGHVFMDLFALGISLLAVRLARRPATAVRTYGWHRAEILAALINSLLLLLLALALFREALLRFSHPHEIHSLPMLIVAGFGLAVNIAIALRLHGHHGEDLNMKSAYLHVLGDAGASLGVIAAAGILLLTHWTPIDSIMSMGISALILVGAIRLLSKATHVLLEAVPMRINLVKVAQAIGEVEGVQHVHDLHIWTVCSHITSLSCHVHLEPVTPARHDEIVKALGEMLWHKFCIYHTTIQVEYERCSDDIVGQDMKHGPPRH